MRRCLAPGYHDKTLRLAFCPHSGARHLVTGAAVSYTCLPLSRQYWSLGV